MTEPPDLLLAPCLFCGYTGPGYWQTQTHGGACPWRHVGGEPARRASFVHTLREALAERDELRGRIANALA